MKKQTKKRMSSTCEILPQKNAVVNRNADEDDTDTGYNEIAVEWDAGEEK
jgi:hypothetical protein